MLAATSTAGSRLTKPNAPGATGCLSARAEHGQQAARATRRGFTLVEAMVALVITAVAGSALLLSINSSMQLTRDSLEQTLAIGMAQQLMDEVVGARYMAVGAAPDQAVFTASAWELQTGTRERFDDIDDFDGWETRPPEDRFGIALGADDGEGGQRHSNFRAPAGFFDNWQQQVHVSYVNPSDLSQSLPSGQTNRYGRAVEVRIVYDDPGHGPRELTRLRRVVVYVPPL
jgi:prepilin-type N-terminal cleavage/methylation domain-containing protein